MKREVTGASRRQIISVENCSLIARSAENGAMMRDEEVSELRKLAMSRGFATLPQISGLVLCKRHETPGRVFDSLRHESD
ncbi:MAG: hypothetical protein CSA13_00040 [Clostridiales bacterium]|nr:MAG: hypothetical protein CSA13_00040 [Clostridiales bacterium]